MRIDVKTATIGNALPIFIVALLLCIAGCSGKPIRPKGTIQIAGQDIIEFHRYYTRLRDGAKSRVTDTRALRVYEFADSTFTVGNIGHHIRKFTSNNFPYEVRDDSIKLQYGWDKFAQDENGNIMLTSKPLVGETNTRVYSKLERFNTQTSNEEIENFLLEYPVDFRIKMAGKISVGVTAFFRNDGYCDLILNYGKNKLWTKDKWKIESVMVPGEYFIVFSGSVKPIQVARIEKEKIIGFSYNFTNEYPDLVKSSTPLTFDKIQGEWKVVEKPWIKLTSLFISSKEIKLFYKDGRTESYPFGSSEGFEMLYLLKSGRIHNKMRIASISQNEMTLTMKSDKSSGSSIGTEVTLYR